MNLGLQEKSALVLASSDGLGRAIALGLAAEGARVTLFARREVACFAVRDEIAALGLHPAHVVVGDLTRADDVQRAVAEAAERHNGLDILVNNCGGPPAGPFASFDDDAWRAAFDLTLLSYVRATRAALPFLRASGEARVLNLVSSSVKSPIENLVLSNVFRLGVIGLTKTLADELGPDRILVNAIGPGRVDTDRIARLDSLRATRAGVTPETIRANTARAIPLGRYGEPAEFARTAVFLCSAANSYVTGQTLLVDGGLAKAY